MLSRMLYIYRPVTCLVAPRPQYSIKLIMALCQMPQLRKFPPLENGQFDFQTRKKAAFSESALA